MGLDATEEVDREVLRVLVAVPAAIVEDRVCRKRSVSPGRSPMMAPGPLTV